MTTKYWLNEKDVITRTNVEWDQFAMKNDGLLALSHRIVGQPLFSFIQSDSTRMFVDVLINRARISNQQVIKEYRCDSPTLRRFMEMKIIPLESKHLLIENRVVREEPLERVRKFVTLETSFLKRCSVCNRVQHKGHWYAPDDAAINEEFEEGFARVSYTICERCRSLF